MKNLSEKFDQLPQDFDREAIWSGIKKPNNRPGYKTYLLLALLLFGSATTALVYYQINGFTAATEVAGTNREVIHPAENSNEITGQEEATGIQRYSDTNPASYHKQSSSSKSDTPLSTRQKETQFVKELSRLQPPESREVIQTHIIENPVSTDFEYSNAVEPLASTLSPLKTSAKKPAFHHQPIVEVYKNRRQSISVRADLGMHTSQFSASDPTLSDIRSRLEKPQLDFGLGLRYEYRLKHNFLLTFAARYHLYKDWINTSYLEEFPGQNILYDYELYNHYHVFSGQIKGGKRFYNKHFFYDLQAGIGMNLHQVSEVDYFIAEGELADELRVANTYNTQSATFLSGEVGIGTNLGKHLFVRMGTEIHSGMRLSGAGAELEHRILPVNGFLELGLKF